MLFSQLETCPISQLQFQANIKYVNLYSMNNSYNPQCDSPRNPANNQPKLNWSGQILSKIIYYSHFVSNSWFAMATRSFNKIAITGQELETETISLKTEDRTSDGRLVCWWFHVVLNCQKSKHKTGPSKRCFEMDGSWGATKQPQNGFKHHPKKRVVVGGKVALETPRFSLLIPLQLWPHAQNKWLSIIIVP